MNPEERKAFGRYLQSLRKTKGYTQREAAKLAHISGPYLAQLEKGWRDPPSREVLRRMAKVYTVTESTLSTEAGYTEEIRFFGVPDERIEWAFQSAIQDPNFAYGTRLPGGELTLETKRFIVELYQNATGRKLFTDDEIDAINQAESEAMGETVSDSASG